MVVACVQASVKVRCPPYRAHGNFNASPRNITVQGVGGGATLTVGVNALSVIQKGKKLDP